MLLFTRFWRIEICGIEFLSYYEDRYTAEMVEDQERINLFNRIGSGAHFLDISVTDVTEKVQDGFCD